MLAEKKWHWNKSGRITSYGLNGEQICTAVCGKQTDKWFYNPRFITDSSFTDLTCQTCLKLAKKQLEAHK